MDELARVDKLYEQVSSLIERFRGQARAAINVSMVYTYFEIGRMIVEVEQGGSQRAEYGQAVLKGLSERLTERFGRGYSEDNLTNMRRFFLVYGQDQISETPFRNFGAMPVTTLRASTRWCFPERRTSFACSKKNPRSGLQDLWAVASREVAAR